MVFGGNGGDATREMRKLHVWKQEHWLTLEAPLWNSENSASRLPHMELGAHHWHPGVTATRDHRRKYVCQGTTRQ